MSTEYYVAVSKTQSVDDYINDLQSNKIQFERLKRFKRLLKITLQDKQQIPQKEKLATFDQCDQQIEGSSFPEVEMSGSYNETKINRSLVEDTKNKVKNMFSVQSNTDSQRIKFNPSNIEQSDNWGLGRICQKKNSFNRFPYKSTFKYSATGHNVDVYVVDSGVDDHPDLQDRVSSLYGNPGDQNGHGTHVATTVAGKKFGVAKEARIQAVRVLGANGSGSNRSIVEGLDSVLEHHQDKNDKINSVVNMSLGGRGSTGGPIATAVDELIENGIPVVVAAGNDNFDLGRPVDYVPAEVERAITVGATTIKDTKARFSNYGEIVDIWAPGHKIIAGYPNERISMLSGTSMASPIVAGVVALMVTGSNKTNGYAEVRQLRDTLVQESFSNQISFGSPNEEKSPNRLLSAVFLR